MDRLTAMQTFVRVAEAGSFTAVADQMNVARSAITRQIAALEAHLGVKLIARSTRRLSLTSAGATYLEQCRDILDRIDEAEGDLAGERQTLQGTIRTSVPLTFGLLHLTPLILEFSRAHPDIHIDLDFNDRRVNLIEEGMDFALRITDRLPETTVARRLTSCRSVVVASPNYLRLHGEPRHPDELTQRACLAYSLTSRSSWSFIIDGVPHSVEISGPLTANNGSVLQEAAIQGMGIAYQPTFIAADAIRQGQLVPILKEFPAPMLDMCAVFPGNRFVPQRVRAFVDFLATRLGPEPYWDQGLGLE
ncbi:MAG: LysR family transcriptional regulator [Rhodocyclaceae bacterium]|nr:MAG: LysR family transcriptional regulator [Rhodocyclaceae bacterium]TND03814.1 MAG: LysR family transcriptional regulator [Rhodocyclaceae bacterium]